MWASALITVRLRFSLLGDFSTARLGYDDWLMVPATVSSPNEINHHNNLKNHGEDFKITFVSDGRYRAMLHLRHLESVIQFVRKAAAPTDLDMSSPLVSSNPFPMAIIRLYKTRYD